LKKYKETRKILSDMLEASPQILKRYVFVMGSGFNYPYKTFNGIKVIKMESTPKDTIYYMPNPMMTL